MQTNYITKSANNYKTTPSRTYAGVKYRTGNAYRVTSQIVDSLKSNICYPPESELLCDARKTTDQTARHNPPDQAPRKIRFRGCKRECCVLACCKLLGSRAGYSRISVQDTLGYACMTAFFKTLKPTPFGFFDDDFYRMVVVKLHLSVLKFLPFLF